MNIKVTAVTFNRLLNSEHFTNTVEGEGYHRHYYYNKDLDQKGIIVINFGSFTPVTQYYLADINA